MLRDELIPFLCLGDAAKATNGTFTTQLGLRPLCEVVYCKTVNDLFVFVIQKTKIGVWCKDSLALPFLGAY